MNLLNTLIQFGLLLSVIWANPIQDIIQKYDDGSPMIINFYEEVARPPPKLYQVLRME